ncbi:hypothetical protein BC739_006665 [Kutzneria viridogrisea]|uniref:Uncharacterized protein n=1 Tax=Kutzneria viridogrisea TaxID=47990 RepID=A0ABR6BRD5_9PSEU|nr:hypothetical protein [Kutzneria viridogrisea]
MDVTEVAPQIREHLPPREGRDQAGIELAMLAGLLHRTAQSAVGVMLAEAASPASWVDRQTAISTQVITLSTEDHGEQASIGAALLHDRLGALVDADSPRTSTGRPDTSQMPALAGAAFAAAAAVLTLLEIRTDQNEGVEPEATAIGFETALDQLDRARVLTLDARAGDTVVSDRGE